MMILRPDQQDLRFPPVESATPEGLLAIGGDLSCERLLEAYRHGIFPWYNPGQPVLWWSPDPRAVLYPGKLRLSRSLRKTLRQDRFRIRFDTAFRDVMLSCAAPRANSSGTWITDEMVRAYCRLHELGHAHSIETWAGERLVGGLYGVALGGVFFGESMFSSATDASKVALVALDRQLCEREFMLIDCQVPSDHLSTLGAICIPRARFLGELHAGLECPTLPGAWSGTLTGPELLEGNPDS